jgi:hypothetical protein
MTFSYCLLVGHGDQLVYSGGGRQPMWAVGMAQTNMPLFSLMSITPAFGIQLSTEIFIFSTFFNYLATSMTRSLSHYNLTPALANIYLQTSQPLHSD